MRLRLPPALTVAAGILLSRLMGLVRERVIAYFLGNSIAAGVFRSALRIPNLLQTLFGEGVLSASFIPAYARLLAEDDQQKARQLAGTVLPFLLLVVTLIVALGMTFADDCVNLIAPGFTASTREITVRLVRIMFPGTGMLVLSAWCLGILNSHRKFFLSYAAGVVWNLGIIIALIYGYATGAGSGPEGVNGLIVCAAWGTVAGAALQFAVQLPQALKLNGGVGLSFDWRSGPFRQVAANFGPAVIARGVVQLSAYIDQILSSYLGPVIVSGLSYAQTLYLLPVSLFGMSISVSELPEMSSATGTDAAIGAAIKARLEKALQRVTYFIVPASVAFIGFGDTVAATLLQTGHFQRADARLVWSMLAALGVGLLANTWSRLLVSSLWAMKETKLPMRIAILRVALTTVLGWVAVFPARAYLALTVEQAAAGLNLTMSFAAWVEYFLERRIVGQRIGGMPPLGRGFWVCVIAALLALGGGHLGRMGVDQLGPLVGGGLSLTLFGVIYLGATLAGGHPEARAVAAKVARKLRTDR